MIGPLIAISSLAAATALLAHLRRRWVMVTVSGISMTPTLQPGDRLLVRRCRIAELKVGDIVVLEPPRPVHPNGVVVIAPARSRTRWKVKRVAALPGDRIPASAHAATGGRETVPKDSLIVFGDADESHDSRQVGLYPGDRILGVAVHRRAGQPLQP
ncbi:S26 family signal peptidase [Streptosporangium sp. NPDC051023]|uniref:S26 family signal peptidase n=1 Tax=Streptosporangium sp. NPDC051023 TaxID=3155410 RepID=UPI00344C6D2B